MNKKIILALIFASVCNVQAAVSIGHIETAGARFLTSAGVDLTAGGVSVGYFPAALLGNDAAFSAATSFADLITAGFVDVRSIAGASSVGVDWDFPLAVSGTVTNIPIGSLAQNTQLYVVAFNAGTFVPGSPSTSFGGSTQWAVVKDNNNITPADLGTKSTALTSVAGAEVLFGTDNGNNVNMTALGAVPEPSRVILGMIGLVALFVRRRR